MDIGWEVYLGEHGDSPRTAAWLGWGTGAGLKPIDVYTAC